MRFNIKNWQDKHLITELDFNNQKAFQKYDAENKIRKSTKITVGGKSTTAGEQGGGTSNGKKAAKAGSKKQPVFHHTDLTNLRWKTLNRGTERVFKREAIPVLNDMLDDVIDNYDGNLDDYKENGMSNMPPNIEKGLDALHKISADGGSSTDVDSFMKTAYDQIEQHLAPKEPPSPKTAFSMKSGAIDGNTFEKMVPELKGYITRQSDEGRADLMASGLKSAGVYGKGNVTLADAEKAVDNISLDDIQAYHDKYKITSETPDVAKTEMKDDLKRLFDQEHRLNKQFKVAAGNPLEVSYATGERIPGWANDPNGGEYKVGPENLPGYDISQAKMSTQEAEWARMDAVGGEKEYNKQAKKLKFKDGQLVSKVSDKKAKASAKMSDDERMDSMSAGEIWSQDPSEPYEYDTSTAKKAGFKFTGGNVDGFNGKDNYGQEGEAAIIDMADQVAKGKMKQSKMDKSLHPEDPRMSDQGRKKELASQNYDESVTSRSTRIQEAKIYRTIQELKGLERVL